MDYEFIAIYRDFERTAHSYGDYLASPKAQATIHRLASAEDYLNSHYDEFTEDDFDTVFDRMDRYNRLIDTATLQLNHADNCLNRDRLAMAKVCLFKAKCTITEVYAMTKPTMPIQAPVADSSTLERLDKQFRVLLKRKKTQKARK